jgi:hypothetical protein
MEFAEKHGLLNGVATIYELLNDNSYFEGMEEVVLVKVLKKLETSGKCELMMGHSSSSGERPVDGVKFFM